MNIILASSLPKSLKKIAVWGFLLRVILLIIVINSDDPFIIIDDRKYEYIASTYLLYANSIWDSHAVNMTGGNSFLQVFWPYVVCVSAKILGTQYSGRILNVILSVLCIIWTYKITTLITDNEERGLLAAKLMAFLPYPLIFSAFNIKDFYIMFGVLYTFTLFVTWQKGFDVSKKNVIIATLLLIGVFFARGGVVEFVGLVFCFFILERFYKKKQYSRIFCAIVIAIVSAYLLKDYIYEAFDEKLEDYGDTALKANGLRLIQMHGISDIYKLPFQYVFGIIQPFTQNYLSILDKFTWSEFMSLMNVSLYPIAFGCLFYMFMDKHNFIFWASTTLLFIVITSMVLAIFRHYFFLFPIHAITFACFVDRQNKKAFQVVKICSCVLFIALFILTLKRL